MNIDMSEIHQVFFDESTEGLNTMESGLLKLSQNADDPDLINDIFRAAHSIKGGGATFGFQAIADFTHKVETILDQIRAGSRTITPALIQILLDSVDQIRIMINQKGDNTAAEENNPLNQKIENILNEENTTTEQQSDYHWEITFKPVNCYNKNSSPEDIIKKLSNLGDISVTVNTANLPLLSEFEIEKCYLSWDINLLTDSDEKTIEEIFSTYKKDSEITWQLKNTPINNPAPQNHTDIEENKSTSLDSIRISTEKIDNLINLVGELVITQSMLNSFEDELEGDNGEQLRNSINLLMRNTRELQESVLQIRMLPISFTFNRFPRLIHDITQELGKKVNLKITGETTELDKTILEKINDPLMHLVRNALDHGIETPEIRKKSGKPETGSLELKAYHKDGNIIVEVIDDGAGLNKEKILKIATAKNLITADQELSDEQIQNLIFEPGFSTTEKTTKISGRGVGMDVVKRNIQSIGGNIHITSETNKGSRIIIRLPLTVAILDGQLIRVENEIYIIPLISIIETLQFKSESVITIANKTKLYNVRDEYIPILDLGKFFNARQEKTATCKNNLLVIVESDYKQYGILIDELLDQQQVVIKSLDTNYQHITGLSGATILGNGKIALILDIENLISAARKKLHYPTTSNLNNTINLQ